MQATNRWSCVRSRFDRSLKENSTGTDGELECSPVLPFIPEEAGTNRERTGTNGTENVMDADPSAWRNSSPYPRPQRSRRVGRGNVMTATRDGDTCEHCAEDIALVPLSWCLMVVALAGNVSPPEPVQRGPARRHLAPKAGD